MYHHVEEVPDGDTYKDQGGKVHKQCSLLHKHHFHVLGSNIEGKVQDGEDDRDNEEDQVHSTQKVEYWHKDPHSEDAQDRDQVDVLETLLSTGEVLDFLQLYLLYLLKLYNF